MPVAVISTISDEGYNSKVLYVYMPVTILIELE